MRIGPRASGKSIGNVKPEKGVGVRAKVCTKETLVNVTALRHRPIKKLDSLIIKLLNISPHT